jgi:metal-sulfur cluster biosynthetic enzyme
MTEDTTPGSNRPNWEAEATHPKLCEDLRKGFSEVMDPELGLNIMQLGLVETLKSMMTGRS